jgi:hypothetical protein
MPSFSAQRVNAALAENQIGGVLAKMMRKFKECRLQFDFNFRHRAEMRGLALVPITPILGRSSHSLDGAHRGRNASDGLKKSA